MITVLLRLLILPTVVCLVMSCHAPVERRVEMVPSPARLGSSEGNLAVGGNGELYLSWMEGRGSNRSLMFSRWEGRSWSTPRVIAQGDSLAGNWTDLPGMTATQDGSLFAYWQVQSGNAFEIRYALSNNSGQTWGPPVSPHPSSTAGQHAFASAATLSPRDIGLIWLDGDETEGSPPMTLRFSRIAMGGELSPETIIDNRVCDCCPTDLSTSGNGTLLAIYRDRSESEIRDMALARYEDGTWRQTGSLHPDGWKIEGCPVNVPALDIDGTRVAAAWYTVDASDRGHVRAVLSTDDGRTFGDPIEIGGANPIGRVDLAMEASGRAWISWVEGPQEHATLRLRSVDGQNGRGPVVTIASEHAVRAFPRLARHGDELFLVWTEGGVPEATQVVTARLR